MGLGEGFTVVGDEDIVIEKDSMSSLREVTRLEVIDEEGRSYVRLGLDKVEASLQDNGKTLKLFINK